MEVDPNFKHMQSNGDVPGGPKKRPWVVLVIVVFCAAVVLAMYVNGGTSHPSKNQLLAPAVLADLDQQTNELAQRLEREPCNNTIATALADKLLEHDEYTAILSLNQNQSTKCGANTDLMPMVFSAQMGLSNFTDAEKTANSLVAEYPADPSAFGWRAQVREKNGNLEGAYSDMQEALLLFPDPANVDGQVYYDTAKLAEKAGHPCEAVATLRDFIAYDVRERRTQQINTLMQGWQKEGACPPLTGVGAATIHYNKHDTSIIIPVEINGVLANMILDTGATTTLLTQDFAKRAGIKPSAQAGGEVSTANGIVWKAGGRADSIVVGGASLRNVPILIHGTNDGSFDAGTDGLLGLSFLGNFQVRISDGMLELKPLE